MNFAANKKSGQNSTLPRKVRRATLTGRDSISTSSKDSVVFILRQLGFGSDKGCVWFAGQSGRRPQSARTLIVKHPRGQPGLAAPRH
jgi:hypothetical protein